jgi:hypothetical protein
MKDLFGYKRGVVISEQYSMGTSSQEKITPNKLPVAASRAVSAASPAAARVEQKADFLKFPCINPEWDKIKIYDADGKVVELVKGAGNDTDKYKNKLSDISFDVNGNYYVRSALTGKFSCSNGKIALDGVEMTPAAQTKQTAQTKQPAQTKQVTTTSKDVYLTPTELKQNVGNKTGVQAFQDWLDTNHSGWHSKYQTLGGIVQKGYCKFGPNTNSAWTTYKKEYLEKNPNLVDSANTIPLTQPKTDATAQPATAQQGQAMKPLANATPIKTNDLTSTSQKPDEIYNTLWSGGLVQGDPEGQGRIRIDVKTLNDDQKEKLKQYMPKLGYEYYRTKNRDGRFVFTKIRQQGEE